MTAVPVTAPLLPPPSRAFTLPPVMVIWVFSVSAAPPP